MASPRGLQGSRSIGMNRLIEGGLKSMEHALLYNLSGLPDCPITLPVTRQGAQGLAGTRVFEPLESCSWGVEGGGTLHPKLGVER